MRRGQAPHLSVTGRVIDMSMLSEGQAVFLASQRVGRLATADAHGNPHVVPVCFAIEHDTLYITIDEKPKRATARPLKRLRNMMDNPSVAFVADRYDDDWSRLAWVMLRGRVDILADGPEHDRAQALLRERYAQYHTMTLGELPVIALRIERVTSWGNLTGSPVIARSEATKQSQ
jgi:PPOX class probable F420-dependent enzyme